MTSTEFPDGNAKNQESHQPKDRDELITDPQNARLAELIEQLIFYRDTKEDEERLDNPIGRPTDYLSEHKSLPIEIYVTYLPNHPRNLEAAHGINLPAYVVSKRYSAEIGYRTKYGYLPDFVVDSSMTEFQLNNDFILNKDGQGIRVETFELFRDETESDDDRKTKWDEDSWPMLDFPISESDLIRIAPLDKEDREYIDFLLRELKDDNFAEGESIQDSGIT